MTSLLFLLACFALVVSYLNVGSVMWGGVRERLTCDIHGLSMIEQERNGHMAMLLPKFTVILLWPAFAVLALVCNVVALIRAEQVSSS